MHGSATSINFWEKGGGGGRGGLFPIFPLEGRERGWGKKGGEKKAGTAICSSGRKGQSYFSRFSF